MKIRKTLIIGAVMGLGVNPAAFGSICQPCPSGTYSSSSTATSCAICPVNSYCIGGYDKQPCPGGTNTRGGKGAKSLSECVADSAAPGAPADQCKVTAPSGFCLDGITVKAAQDGKNWTMVKADDGQVVQGICSSAIDVKIPSSIVGTTCNVDLCSSDGGDSLNAAFTTITTNYGTDTGYCYCRAKSSAGGAWSSWVFRALIEDRINHYTGKKENWCKYNCARDCANNVSSWGAKSSW